MDPVTQGLLGAAVAQAGYTKHLKKSAVLIGFVAGIAADIDILFSQNTPTEPLNMILYHRHFTHSLAFIPIGGLIIAALFLAFLPYLRRRYQDVMWASCYAFGTHGLLDTCTSWGTQLMWPFSNQRFYWDIISIIDPVFTSLLLLGISLSFFLKKIKFVWIALFLCGFYLLFGVYQNTRAIDHAKALAVKRVDEIEKIRAIPTLGNLVYWNTVYSGDGIMWRDKIRTPFFSPAFHVDTGNFEPQFQTSDFPEWVILSTNLINEWRTFRWFADGFVYKASDNPLILKDFGYEIWGIEFPSEKLYEQHIQWRTFNEGREERLNEIKKHVLGWD